MRVFIDTNILVYAYDREAKEKHEHAQYLVRQLWEGVYTPVISIQVLQEFFVTLLRKQVSSKKASLLIEDYLKWNVVMNDEKLLREGIKIQSRWKTSFWDALILAAANQESCQMVWSEDFNHQQKYGSVKVINPFFTSVSNN